MKTVLVASTNPVKIRATQTGFERVFPNQSFNWAGENLPSGVSDQPSSESETLQGALNRAENAFLAHPTADYWVGIEGGVEEEHGDMFVFAWVVVRSRELVGKGRTAAFVIPPAVARLVRSGTELGEADDIVFGRTNSKQANGAVGLLTRDIIDREELYRPAVILALIPFINPQLFLE